MEKANYRKNNDHSHSSSTYHKKDGTAVRQILKREAEDELKGRLDRFDRTVNRDTDDEALRAKKRKDGRKMIFQSAQIRKQRGE